MIDITELDGCQEFDEHLMEASIVGVVSPELGAHIESCSPCAVAMANYQLAARAIRGSEVTAVELTPAAPIRTGGPDVPRLRALGPRTLIAAASIAAALMAWVHFGTASKPIEQSEHLVANGSTDPGKIVSSGSNSMTVSTDRPIGSGTALVVSAAVPLVNASLGQVPTTEGALGKRECIDVGGRCYCCVDCDIQTLVGNDLPEHRIPAALHGLKIGDRVTSSTLPSGGFIVDERSSLL